MQFKYEQLSECIRSDIHLGRYPKGKLPNLLDLARQHSVGQVTVSHALKKLTEEGLIQRVQKKGTIIVGSGKGVSLSHQAGIIMRQGGHFFSEMYFAVIRQLQERGYFPVSVDLDSEKESLSRERMSRLLCSPLKGIIMDGASYSQFPFLKEYSGKRIVLVNYYDGSGDVPGYGVFMDYEKGTYVATSHLLGLGHRNILLLALKPGNYREQDEPYRVNHPLRKSEDGFRRALSGFQDSAKPEIAYYKGGEMQGDDLVRGHLSRQIRPTGIICYTDHVALSVISIAHQMGLRVPEDLSVIGMYNTPRSEDGHIPLTSVSFEETEIARQAVDMMLANNPEPKIRYIEPKLIVRSSCGNNKIKGGGI